VIVDGVEEKKRRLYTRPTWVEVSLSVLRQNFRVIQEMVGNAVTVCAVVKADAYGHGSPDCARALEAEGARWLGVTSTDEGVILRDAGVRSRVLLMSGFWRGEESDILAQDLTPVVWDEIQIESLNRAAGAAGLRGVPIHLKLDTGMGRLGATVEDLPGVLDALKRASHLYVEGVASHLASSDVLDAVQNDEQSARFDEMLNAVLGTGLSPQYLHLANTSALLSRRNSWKNMVRPGIAMYGYALKFRRRDRVEQNRPPLPVAPALSWKTRILSIKHVSANQPLGYNACYTTSAPATIAVLPVGYADGFDRRLSNRGTVIVRGRFAPIVGLISMDLTLVDVTGISSVEVGDEVTLLGRDGDCSIDAWDHARLCSTVPYEILCAVSTRVPRRYLP
jgi:alanine racemase